MSNNHPSTHSSFLRRLFSVFAADLRSLALFRISLGTLLFFDLLTRFPNIRDFYTDWGVLPREALIREFMGSWELSFHLINGQYVVQLVLFSAALVFSLALAFGYRTRLSAFVCWAFVCSMQVRLGIVTHGGDDLFRMMLFWCMFVPLNGRYSLDRALNPTPLGQPEPLPLTHLSLGAACLLIQLCIMYWFTAALKWHPVWHTDGTAIYYALHLDQFAKPLGKFLLNFPAFMQMMTFATLIFEFVAPFMLFSPLWHGPLRLVVVLSFIGFHTGLGLTMELGPFPWVCAAAWLAFLPGWFWDKLEAWSPRSADEGLVLYFDAECGFCRKSVLILRELLMLGRARIAEAQSDPKAFKAMKENNSWVVASPNGEFKFGYEGFLELARRSVVLRPLSGFFALAPVRAIGWPAYRWVASHRVRSSKALKSVSPPAPVASFGWRTQVVAAAFLVLIIFWNLSHFESLGIRIPQPIRAVASVTQVYQNWGMFAPYPRKDDGWYVIKGVFFNGQELDLRTEKPVTLEKPESVADTFADSQWRKYLTNLWMKSYHEHRLYFGRYLCRVWNDTRTGDDRLNLIYINYMMEMTPEPGQPVPKATEELIWRHYCFDKPAGW